MQKPTLRPFPESQKQDSSSVSSPKQSSAAVTDGESVENHPEVRLMIKREYFQVFLIIVPLQLLNCLLPLNGLLPVS